jgi:AcrR family transcriptional regulator
VAEICRRADVTKGGFYHHFPSKQAVFLEMLERWLEGIDDGLAAARAGGQNVPEELLAFAVGSLALGLLDPHGGDWR